MSSVKTFRTKPQVIEYLEARSEKVPFSGCWIWTETITKKGYARSAPEGKFITTHRWAYIKLFGDIGGRVVDHQCRVRCCVNPAHLRALTNKENILIGISPTADNAKKNLCPRGHEYDGIGRRSNGTEFRFCRTCRNQWNRAYGARYREKRRIALAAKRTKKE